jgi:RNA polymerase sigma-70 factor (ECF subfamily)
VEKTHAALQPKGAFFLTCKIQMTTNLSPPILWQTLKSFISFGTTYVSSDPDTTNGIRLYRVSAEQGRLALHAFDARLRPVPAHPPESGTTPSGTSAARRPAFVTTHWSVVLAAGRNDTHSAHEALSRLCRTYWYPLYAYVRRRGNSPADAQDLTQEFFARLLEQGSIALADPGRGRFRSFILTAMNNFLASEWKKARARKRGGDVALLSIDLAVAEERLDLEPPDPAMAPDRAFDRHWAMTLLETVLNRLEEEYRRDQKSELFESLKQTLTDGGRSQPYAEVATKLRMSEGSVKVAVHRLRKRYRQLLEAEVANTLCSPRDVLMEMRDLFKALAGT